MYTEIQELQSAGFFSSFNFQALNRQKDVADLATVVTEELTGPHPLMTDDPS